MKKPKAKRSGRVKTFLPLHPLTIQNLEAFPIRSQHRTQQDISARYNAAIYPALGALIDEMLDWVHWENATDWTGSDDCKPEIPLDDLAKFFGNLATGALLHGDKSFFAQVDYCMNYEKDSSQTADRKKNEDILTAHRVARTKKKHEAKIEKGVSHDLAEISVHAGEVAEMHDLITRKRAGTTTASAAVDLCTRKAVNLPLAKGKRGPRKD